jgi:hypothetical protein
MRPLQQFAQALGEKQRENFSCVPCTKGSTLRAREARANTNSGWVCLCPQRNNQKAPVDFPLILVRCMKFYFIAGRELESQRHRESERAGRRGVAARGFSIFSLLLTQSVNTLSVMYRANQLLVFVRSLRRAHRQRTDRHALCAVKRCFCSSTSTSARRESKR